MPRTSSFSWNIWNYDELWSPIIFWTSHDMVDVHRWSAVLWAAGAVRIAEDVVGRPWSPLCSSLWGVISRSRWLIQIVGPRGLGVSQCSMVFRIVYWLKDGWKLVKFISFAFKKHVDVHTHIYNIYIYSCCVTVGSHTHTQDIGLKKSMHIHNLI